MQTLWLVNGQPTGVDPADRGLAYGDGLFETMAARDGKIRWLELHLDRLEAGCARLKIPVPAREAVAEEIAGHCPKLGPAVVKLIVTRGPGTRGYAPPNEPRPTRILAVSPWPEYPRNRYETGIEMRVLQLRLGDSPALAGLKHLCRLEQVLAEIELAGHPAPQGLLLDGHGFVVGGTSSNVFAVVDSEVVTPSLARCGVKGVMRRVVLEAAATLKLRVAERDLALAELLAAQEIFVTNAIFGIWPVARIDSQVFAVGPTTRRLMAHVGYPHA